MRILRANGLLILFIIAAAFVGCSRNPETVRVTFSEADGKPIGNFQAEIAASNSAREIGLMYRKDFGDDDAMLFIFPSEAPRSFWMKNTYVELDMVFVSAANKIVSIVERAVPLTESPRASKGPAQYVLEIKGGRSKALGLHAGMIIKVEGSLPAAGS